MRKKIKKEIRGIIKTLLEAHEYVIFLLQNKRIAEANDILSQCQDCAAHIGESIEQSEGMDTIAVSLLESYCELLFKMSSTIEKKRLNSLKHQLDIGLQQVEYEITYNIPQDRLKIVFLPYKASMWDCMESVWEAANADEECDTYVVPIPYYERNEHGEAEKFCYEGELFPEEVPIISYEKFSLEAERPDIAYIHNPYDGNNYVTSVHPDYYTENLKKYVDELVYIPYYILGEGGMPDSHRSLVTYNNIDKIIVQDEDKKESMLDYVPEEKIAVIGCPKVDRILKLNQKKQKILENGIPQEWKRKIAGKKVILFNISITGILNNKRYAMDKIRYILSCFENRDDVVLLWRPHPLIEATLKSMRPEIYEEYMTIRKSFIRKGKGIFDETGDAGIAAVVADAYLGESTSSLVHYFGVLGKPVMYIDWNTVEDTRLNRDVLHFNTYYREGYSLFFIPHNAGFSHQLYKLDLKDGKIEKVLVFPGSAEDRKLCYSDIIRVKNKFILVPGWAEDVYIYDIQTKQGIKIVLSESQKHLRKFDKGIEYEGKLFLVPAGYPAIVSIDLDNFEIHEFKECIQSFLLDEPSKLMFSWGFIKREQYLYLASCNESRILIFNMEDGSYKIKEIGDYPYGYCRIIYDGKYFWLGGYNTNHIVRWDETTDEIKEFTFPIDQKPSEEWYFSSSIIEYGDEIILFYGFSANIVFMNKITGECRKSKRAERAFIKTQRDFEENQGGFMCVYPLDTDTILLFDWKNDNLHTWNIDDNSFKHYPCRMDRKEMLDMEKHFIEKYWTINGTPRYLAENIVSITQFVDYIVEWDASIFKQTYECYYGIINDSNIGIKIHETVKG